MSQKTTKSARTAVVVLGMHRSGTSALAGVLNTLGCDKPATPMDINEANSKGYFESKRIYALHNALLQSAGSRWDDWTPFNQNWLASPRADEYQERAIETLQDEYGESRLFIIKDPRICRLVPFWQNVLKEKEVTPLYVLTHRNPLEVAASLQKRDGLGAGTGLLIWLRHVLDAEHGTRGQSRCFTNYAQLMTNWAGVADKIQSSLGLNLPRFSLGVAPEIEAFLEGGLRHHREVPEKVLHNPMLSTWLRDTYEILERWVIDGEDESDHGRLDAIRAAFDESGPAFADVVQSGRSEAERLSSNVKALSSELGTLKEEKTAAAARIEDLRTGVARSEQEAEQLKAEVATSKSRISELEKAIAKSNGARDAQAADLEELRKDVGRKQRALEQSNQEADETRKVLEALRTEFGQREGVFTKKLAEHDLEVKRLEGARDAQAAELEELRKDAAEKQRAFEQSSQETEEKRKNLEALRIEFGQREGALTTQLAERDRELERLEGTRDVQAAEIDELQDRLSREQSALKQRSHEAEETHKALEALQVEFAERERAHALLVTEREADAREIGRLKEEVAAAEIRLRDAEALSRDEIAAKVLEVQSLEASLKAQYRELAGMTHILASKEAEIEQERKAAAQTLERERQNSRETFERERSARSSAEARTAELDNRVQTQFRELSELSRLLAQSEQSLTAARVQAQADLAAAQSKLEAEAGHVVTARAQEAEAHAREQRLRDEITALRTSTSWRLTQPLRSFVDRIRGNRH